MQEFPQHKQLPCRHALVSCPYIYSCVNTRGSPAPMGVMVVANGTPQSFSAAKHPQGYPDLPEQPQAWLLLPGAGGRREGGRVYMLCHDTAMLKQRKPPNSVLMSTAQHPWAVMSNKVPQKLKSPQVLLRTK